MKTMIDKSLQIRTAKKNDMPAILQLIGSRLKHDKRFAKGYYERYFSDDELTEDDLVLVALVDGHTVGVSGYSANYFSNKYSYWLGWTVVAEEFSRNPQLQVGSRLLEAVEKDLQKYKVKKLFVSTEDKNGPAINFYVKHSFEFEGRLRDFYYDGEDQIILSKRLGT